MITTQIQKNTVNLYYKVTNALSQENDMHRTARLTISLSDSLMYVVLCILNSFSDVKAEVKVKDFPAHVNHGSVRICQTESVSSDCKPHFVDKRTSLLCSAGLCLRTYFVRSLHTTNF